MCESRQLLITGAGGWIGRALMAAGRADHDGTPAPTTPPSDRSAPRAIDARKDLPGQFDAIDPYRTTVIHLAAIAHRDGPQDDRLYREVNCDLAVRTARAAAEAGIGRFVFVSTARVMGEVSVRPWTEEDAPAPRDPYSAAKWQAERSLLDLHHKRAIDVVVLRPPLVYGPGVRANFLRLLRVADTGWPIPVCFDGGRRSMVYLDNLVSALRFASTDALPAGRSYFVRDGRDWTTADLLAGLRRRLARPERLVRVPCAALRIAASVIGRTGLYDRLFGASQVSDDALRSAGWQPPVGPDDALQHTVQWWRCHSTRAHRSA